MTQEAFKKILDEKGYSYGIEGGKLIVYDRRSLNLRTLETIPSGVEFRNIGGVDLRSLKSIPPGVEFKNIGIVGLMSLTGGWFHSWDGAIREIKSHRILNKMIEDGLFNR